MVGKVVFGDAREASNYPEQPFHLTITSPPYYCDKDYEEDYTFDDYLGMLKQVLTNVAANTVPGGKICINIADIAAFSKVSGRVEEYLGVSRDIQTWMAEQNCFLLARTIWSKDDPWVNSQHVAYHDKVPATYVRQLPSWEYVWTYYKQTPSREGLGPITQYLSKEDWKRWVSSVWFIRSVLANNDHPAKFPEELVRRLALLYSVPGDTIFDPFMGSGTTGIVAQKTGRNYAGIERDPDYYKLCLENLENAAGVQELAFEPPDKFKQNKLEL